MTLEEKGLDIALPKDDEEAKQFELLSYETALFGAKNVDNFPRFRANHPDIAEYRNNTRDPDRRRRRCLHAKFTAPGLAKWCRRTQGASCTRCCSYFSAILRCGYNRRDPPPADPSQHGARDGKQKLQQSKSNIPPHVQNPATSKRPYAHPA